MNVNSKHVMTAAVRATGRARTAYREILANRLQLVTSVVVGAPRTPSLLNQVQGLPQDVLRAHRCGIWCLHTSSSNSNNNNNNADIKPSVILCTNKLHNNGEKDAG